MKTKVMMWQISCDSCGQTFVDESGSAVFPDAAEMEEWSQIEGWHAERGSNYCPRCYILGENDNLILLP